MAAPTFLTNILMQRPMRADVVAREVNHFFERGGTSEVLVNQLNWAAKKDAGECNAFGDPGSMPLIEAIKDYSQLQMPVALAAVSAGRLDLLDLYLERGADPEASNDWGVALVMAAKYLVADDALVMVRRLLKAGADPNVTLHENGCTPLMYAAALGNVEMFGELLDAGADVRRTCSEGQTALHRVMRPLIPGKRGQSAGRFRNADPVTIAKTLLERGVDVNARSFRRETPLHALAGDCSEHLRPLLGVLLDAGANIEARNRDGATPLLLAAQSNARDAVVALLEAGAIASATQFGRKLKDFGDAETKRVVKSALMSRTIESAMPAAPSPSCESGGPAFGVM